jgi:hypothetical protein
MTNLVAPKPGGMLAVRAYFGPWNGMSDFKDQWLKLTEKDKEELKSGIESGTLTY